MEDTSYQAFLDILHRLSPENLHADGERSPKEAQRIYKKLMHKWHDLEKEVGREVSDEEVYQWHMRKIGIA